MTVISELTMICCRYLFPGSTTVISSTSSTASPVYQTTGLTGMAVLWTLWHSMHSTGVGHWNTGQYSLRFRTYICVGWGPSFPDITFLSVRAEWEGWTSRAIAQLYIQHCNPHIMGDVSVFKRGQIVGAHLAGTYVTRTASLCGVLRATVSRVMSAY